MVADFVMVKGESSVEYGNSLMPGEPLIGPRYNRWVLDSDSDRCQQPEMTS